MTPDDQRTSHIELERLRGAVVRDIAWAKQMLEAHAATYDHECAVCGSRQTVLLQAKQHIYCRMCRTTTANVYAHPPPSDKLREHERITKDMALEMIQEVLAAFEIPHNKARLSEAKAHGSYRNCLCYGFTNNLEGVLKSIRAVQEHCGDNPVFHDGLERLRLIFSPFNTYELEDARIRQEEAAAREEALAQEAQRVADAKKMEELAQERREIALKRAKKVARGLDPNQMYLPAIVRQPPETIVLLPGRKAFVSIVADRTESFQWYLNGARLSEDTPGVLGATTAFLKLEFFTKSLSGTYVCECINDDGRLRSTPCLVQLAQLKPTMVRRVDVANVPHGLAVDCEAGLVTLLSTKGVEFRTVVALEMRPVVGAPAVAEPFAALTGSRENWYIGLANGSLLHWRTQVQMPPPPPTETPAPVGKRRMSVMNALDTNADAKRRASVRRLSACPQVRVTHAERHDSSLAVIRVVQFLAHGTWLLLSDERHAVYLYHLPAAGASSALPLLLATFVITAPQGARILRVVGSTTLPFFAVAYTHSKHVDLYRLTALTYTKTTVTMGCRVSAMAFPPLGFQLAVGEQGIQHGFLRVLNLETRVSQLHTRAHFGPIEKMQFMAEFVLCTVGMDRAVKLWDTTKKTCLVEFMPQTAVPSALFAFGPSSVLLAFYSKQVELWHIANLDKVLASIETEHLYAIVMVQKQWRGALARHRLKLQAVLTAAEASSQGP
ncbi:hypothetical protein ACHHYP_04994 [Achlya hypogyna]|uniref:Ig-like domain-containing protein n=1 Tax=Achlya hypogyna TaxID=1202772 RepID=A0A1V9YZ58_ACHHY|nr:hypothetical protein ACHHYP_04994 [Achlya hypogyna]